METAVSRTLQRICGQTMCWCGGTDLKFPSKTPFLPFTTAKATALGVIVFRDVSAARAMARPDHPFRRAHFLTGFAQSHVVERPGQQGRRPGAPSREESGSPVSGPGWLQAHERLSRPSRRTATCNPSPSGWWNVYAPRTRKPQARDDSWCCFSEVERSEDTAITARHARPWPKPTPSTTTTFTSPASIGVSVFPVDWTQKR